LLRACADKDVGLVISNAGFGLKGEHHALDAARLTAMLNVNSHAPMLLAHAFAPRLIARGRGGLLLTGSIEGFIGFPWSAAYAATKAFVMTLGEALWGELRAHGVDVMVLTPGATDTDAPTLQGIDKHQLAGLMPPSEVVRQALARLGGPPVFVPGWLNRVMVRFLTSVPRRLGVLVAGKGMRDAIRRSGRRVEAVEPKLSLEEPARRRPALPSPELRQDDGRVSNHEGAPDPGQLLLVSPPFPMLHVDTRVENGPRHVTVS